MSLEQNVVEETTEDAAQNIVPPVRALSPVEVETVNGGYYRYHLDPKHENWLERYGEMLREMGAI